MLYPPGVGAGHLPLRGIPIVALPHDIRLSLFIKCCRGLRQIIEQFTLQTRLAA
jgi:hypothetical protein